MTMDLEPVGTLSNIEIRDMVPSANGGATCNQPPKPTTERHDQMKNRSLYGIDSSFNDSGSRNECSSSSSSSSSNGEESDSEAEMSLVKPMSMLPVCPRDEEDDEDAQEQVLPQQPFQEMQANRNPTLSVTLEQVMSPSIGSILQRNPATLRHQYMKQLGLKLPHHNLEHNIGKKRTQPQSVKIKLKQGDDYTKRRSQGIFRAFSSWYGGKKNREEDEENDSHNENEISTDATKVDSMAPTSLVKSVGFNEEADMYFIPMHKEYTERQRNGMWHTREAFVSMVERNLEDMYDEMEREYERQLQQQADESQQMRLEEERQRLVAKAVKSRKNKVDLFLSEESLFKLIPKHEPTHRQLQQRARSPHAIRSKYLKHLGINR